MCATSGEGTAFPSSAPVFTPCFYTPTRREGAILQSPYPSVRPSVCPSVHTFVKDVSAATGRKDFIFDT